MLKMHGTKKEKKNTWEQGNSIANRAFVSHAINLGSILGTPEERVKTQGYPPKAKILL